MQKALVLVLILALVALSSAQYYGGYGYGGYGYPSYGYAGYYGANSLYGGYGYGSYGYPGYGYGGYYGSYGYPYAGVWGKDKQ